MILYVAVKLSILILVMFLSWERMPIDVFCWLCVCVSDIQSHRGQSVCLYVWMCAWALPLVLLHTAGFLSSFIPLCSVSRCDGFTLLPSSLRSLHDFTVCAVPLLLWWRIFWSLVSGFFVPVVFYLTWPTYLFSFCFTRFNHQWLCKIKGEYLIQEELISENISVA